MLAMPCHAVTGGLEFQSARLRPLARFVTPLHCRVCSSPYIIEMCCQVLVATMHHIHVHSVHCTHTSHLVTSVCSQDMSA